MTKTINLSLYDERVKEFFSANEKALSEYKKLFNMYNKTHNISRLKNIDDEIKDSILPYFLLEDEGIYLKNINALDVGSGAGFAGLFLAMIDSSLNMSLCELSSKKASFLTLVKISLGLSNVKVINDDVSKLDTKYDLISSRAMSKTYDIINLCKNSIQENTMFLFYKGSNVYEESEFLKTKVVYNYGFRNYLFFKKSDLNMEKL